MDFYYKVGCESGNMVRYKVRLVAQGYYKVKGDTYNEVFRPVVHFPMIHLFFSFLLLSVDGHTYNGIITCAYLYTLLGETLHQW